MNEEPLIEGKQLTATEIEELCRQWGKQVREKLDPFLGHIIDRCVKIMVDNGHISNEQIEKIANDEIVKYNEEKVR